MPLVDVEDEVEILEDSLPLIGKIVSLVEQKMIVRDDTEDIFRRKFTKAACNPDEFEKVMINRAGTAGSKYQDDALEMTMYGATDTIEPVYNMESLAKLYDNDPFHAAAVDALVDNIVGLGYYFDYSRASNKVREKASQESPERKIKVDNKLEDKKQELDDYINDMNKMDSLDEILERVVKDRFSMGNGYIEIGRTIDGQIGYIGHIPAQGIRIRRKRDGFVQYVGHKPVFFRNFGDLDTPNPFSDEIPNEIIHFRKYSPIDQYYGVPEIVSAVDAIAGNQYATQYNIEYFQNKAVPRYVIKTKGVRLDLTQKRELLQFFETSTLGRSHRSVLVPLPANEKADIEFEAIETGKQEASFGEYTEANIKTILARHRVPINRLGIVAGGTGDSRDSDKIFKEAVCRPEQRIIEKLFSRFIKELTNAFIFKLNEYTLTDEDQQSTIDERDLRMGVLLPDERRAKIGLPPRPDSNGDEPLDIRALEQMKLDSAEKLQGEALKSQEKVAKQNAAVKASVNATPGGSASTQAKADQKAKGTRTRDANRSATRSNAAQAPSTRNSKGQGSKTT